MKIKIFKVYDKYCEYESYNVLAQGCINWVEINKEELKIYKETVHAANSYPNNNDFKYVLVEDTEDMNEVFTSAKQFFDEVEKRKAKEVERKLLAEEKRKADKLKSEEKKLEQKRKQLEKLRKELGE